MTSRQKFKENNQYGSTTFPPSTNQPPTPPPVSGNLKIFLSSLLLQLGQYLNFIHLATTLTKISQERVVLVRAIT